MKLKWTGSRADSGGAGLRATTGQLVLVAALFWTLSADSGFLTGALRGRDAGQPGTWAFGLGLATLLVALHTLLLGLVAHRRIVKPLLALLTLVAAGAAYFSTSFGVVLEPSMLRNVLRTDVAEARELLTPALAVHLLLYAGLPLVLLWKLQLVQQPWRRALLSRLQLLAGALAVLLVLLWLLFQPLSSLMRNDPTLRYRIAPENVLWSSARVLLKDARGAARPREPIGTDAHAGPAMAARHKPLVLVLVVGETARAANWGLNGGGARDTTPQLAAAGVVNFPNVGSCGTNTEVSVPCLFAPVGRRAYDEDRIRGQQSLLHVLARAGVAVHWRDNQSGCKGVCDGLPNDQVGPDTAPGLCAHGHCLDEGLIHDLDARLAAAQGTQVWVLHMLGNHGPAYARRHPPEFERFTPACPHEDLRLCAREQIANSYDNALLYTDHVLARAIARLQAHADTVDSALLFVSDHGESLGEHGLFLHGMPYAIAPREQTRVPMVFWASAGFEQGAGLEHGCLRLALQRQAQGELAHDHVFHTVLGLLDVRTALHERDWDLSSPCQGLASAATGPSPVAALR